MNLDLSGKRALVAGSTQGIGKASAMELAELGASITLIARNEEKLKTVLQALPKSKNQKHDYLVADFSQPDLLKAKILNYLSGETTIQILLNNTGGPPGGPAIDAKLEEYHQAFSNHLICNHILAQACVPGMKTSGYGRIINIISTSVKQPLPGLGVSNTIRGAVANWAKSLANELGQFNITVNNVLPGATMTSRLESIISNKSGKLGLDKDQILEQMANAVPMKRVAKPAEIAAAVAFLASPAASYINGINVPVDGGRTASL
jgi:3-oxoacyl-[acyl-carrier protein] reductase